MSKYWICTYRFKRQDEPSRYETWLIENIHPAMFLADRCQMLHEIHQTSVRFTTNIVYSEEISVELFLELRRLEVPKKKTYDNDLQRYLYYTEIRS